MALARRPRGGPGRAPRARHRPGRHRGRRALAGHASPRATRCSSTARATARPARRLRRAGVVDAGAAPCGPAAASTARRAAAIGTAGFTAMLSVLRLERDVAPDDGDIVVTGAAGGVGSVAIAVLSRLGYSVTASSGRVAEQGDYLRRLGAARHDRPRRTVRAGQADAAGTLGRRRRLGRQPRPSRTCSRRRAGAAPSPRADSPRAATCRRRCCRSSCAGVTLAGVNSVEAPLDLREQAWERLARDLDLDLLDSMTERGRPRRRHRGRAGRSSRGRLRGRTVVGVRR